jgi:hypothetical protein
MHASSSQKSTWTRPIASAIFGSAWAERGQLVDRICQHRGVWVSLSQGQSPDSGTLDVHHRLYPGQVTYKGSLKACFPFYLLEKGVGKVSLPQDDGRDEILCPVPPRCVSIGLCSNCTAP